jgi:hypothetical protein
VVVVVIGMLMGIVLGALRKAQNAARLAHTKATIAKLDRILMARYEVYRTRRVPLSFTGLSPLQAALLRMQAIRDLMRMEMPQRYNDVSTPPLVSGLPQPALQRLYQQKMTKEPADHEEAKCLYLVVMTANPANRSLFNQDEIADVDGDGLLSFVDGWGKPIAWLRWAPGFTNDNSTGTLVNHSDIQIDDTGSPVSSGGNLNLHHDPFDPRVLEMPGAPNPAGGTFTNGAFQLFPLIFSGITGNNGTTDEYAITLGRSHAATVNPYDNDPKVGNFNSSPYGGEPITNQHMEQR